MQEYLDTANDQIQVDKHQLNPVFLGVGVLMYLNAIKCNSTIKSNRTVFVNVTICF